jgi:hypothetical protein
MLCLLAGVAFAENKKPNLQAINNSIGVFSEEDVIPAEEAAIVDVLRAIFFWFSPGIFFVVVLLILYGNYKKLELMLSREMGIRKKIFPKLENYNYTFHDWLLEKNTLIGVICIACALAFFFILR